MDTNKGIDNFFSFGGYTTPHDATKHSNESQTVIDSIIKHCGSYCDN